MVYECGISRAFTRCQIHNLISIELYATVGSILSAVLEEICYMNLKTFPPHKYKELHATPETYAGVLLSAEGEFGVQNSPKQRNLEKNRIF